MEVTLPYRFWNDHSERGLPSGRVIKSNGREVTLEVTEDELREIWQDAEFYADPYGPDCAPRGVVASAKATAQRIRKLMA